MAVRTRNDLLHWLQFFLTAIEETAVNSKKTFVMYNATA